MNATSTMSLGTTRLIAICAGIASLAACALGATINPREFFVCYLFGFLFWLGIALGCSSFLMIHHLTGGKWGYAIRRLFEAAIATLPALAILFLPIFFGLARLYPWATKASTLNVSPSKLAYMNAPAFIVRTIVVFAIWILIAWLLTKWSAEQDTTESVEPTKKLRKLSGPGLVIYALTVTFAYVDWVMSMEADWYSTVFPLLICVGQMLSALAFIIILLNWYGPRTSLAEILSKENFHHLGNLLLTFTMLWAYLAYSQLIVIWSGDLPHEISWYLHRIAGGWRWIAVTLLIFHFFGPFFLLLFSSTKRTPRILVTVAAIILLTHVLDVWWMVAPSLYQDGFHVSWMTPAALLGVGGIWFAVFLTKLESNSLIPVNDPRFAVALST